MRDHDLTLTACPLPKERTFLLTTESGSEFTLTLTGQGALCRARLVGWSRGAGVTVEVSHAFPLTGGRNLFTVPPREWLGQTLRVGAVITSPVVQVADAERKASYRLAGRGGLDNPPTEVGSSRNTCERLSDELVRARRENEQLRVKAAKRLRVSGKGGVSVYGLNKLPVTLYRNQWLKLLEMRSEILAFIDENEHALATKS